MADGRLCRLGKFGKNTIIRLWAKQRHNSILWDTENGFEWCVKGSHRRHQLLKKRTETPQASNPQLHRFFWAYKLPVKGLEIHRNPIKFSTSAKTQPKASLPCLRATFTRLICDPEAPNVSFRGLKSDTKGMRTTTCSNPTSLRSLGIWVQ